MTLSATIRRARQVTELIKNTGKDIISASAGPGGIVYEQFGQIHIYDLATGKEHAVPIEIDGRPERSAAAFSERRARDSRREHLAHRRAGGVRSARRNSHRAGGEGRYSQSDQHAGRDGADAGVVAGRPIDRLFLRRIGRVRAAYQAAERRGRTRKDPARRPIRISISTPNWSPDSKHIAFNDNQLNLWDVDVASGKLTKVDTDYSPYELGRDFAWSPRFEVDRVCQDRCRTGCT